MLLVVNAAALKLHATLEKLLASLGGDLRVGVGRSQRLDVLGRFYPSAY